MQKPVPRLIIRADADAGIGTGHLMRCLALAQHWQDTGGQTTFVTACSNESLLQRLRDEGFEVVTLPRPFPNEADWERTAAVLAAHPGAAIVLDGYHFDEDYQQRLGNLGNRLLVIDDMAQLEHYHADIILNQNLHADLLRYNCDAGTELLLGTRYVLLRRDFQAQRGGRRQIPDTARRLLITFGGSDPDNHTLKVMRALRRADIPSLEATAVVGAGNPHYAELEAAVQDDGLPVRLVRNAANMPELMAEADLAVTSGGTTVWEMAFMGLPALVATTTPIEEFLARGLKKHGLFTSIGWIKQLSEDELAGLITGLARDGQRRREMSEQGRRLVTGEGCGTVRQLLANGGTTIEV